MAECHQNIFSTGARRSILEKSRRHSLQCKKSITLTPCSLYVTFAAIYPVIFFLLLLSFRNILYSAFELELEHIKPRELPLITQHQNEKQNISLAGWPSNRRKSYFRVDWFYIYTLVSQIQTNEINTKIPKNTKNGGANNYFVL